MTDPEQILLALASDLSVRARELLLCDSTRLQTRNDRTYDFLSRDRRRNPLRAPYEVERLQEVPSEHWFGEANTEVLRALRCHPSGVYTSSVGMQFARWIGPDGVLVCNRTKGEQSDGWITWTASFEDGTGVRVGPTEIDPGLLESKIKFIETTGDLFEDYRLALEGVAHHIHITGARPLYRFEDPDLDIETHRYYWEHTVPLAGAVLQRGLDWFMDKVEAAPEALEKYKRKQALKAERELERRAKITAEGIVYTCQTCERSTRVPFHKLGETGKCGQCGAELPTTDFPIDASTSGSLEKLLKRSPVPVLLDFWAGWCGPCLIAMPQLVAAAAESDGRFAIVRVNADHLEHVAAQYGVQALPTMIRFERGRETGREMGVKPKEKIVGLALP